MLDTGWMYVRVRIYNSSVCILWYQDSSPLVVLEADSFFETEEKEEWEKDRAKDVS